MVRETPAWEKQRAPMGGPTLKASLRAARGFDPWRWPIRRIRRGRKNMRQKGTGSITEWQIPYIYNGRSGLVRRVPGSALRDACCSWCTARCVGDNPSREERLIAVHRMGRSRNTGNRNMMETLYHLSHVALKWAIQGPDAHQRVPTVGKETGLDPGGGFAISRTPAY